MKSLLTIVSVLILLSFAGCRAIDYQDPSGRKVSIWVFGTDTQIGDLVATAPDGTAVHLTNYNSEATALQTVDDALKLAETVATKTPMVKDPYAKPATTQPR